jgi:hypothetical protein
MNIISGVLQILMLIGAYVFLIYITNQAFIINKSVLVTVMLCFSVLIFTKALIYIIKDFIRENIEEYK